MGAEKRGYPARGVACSSRRSPEAATTDCGRARKLQRLGRPLRPPCPFQMKTERSMPSVFEPPPAASAIPITFATKATWDAICAELPTQARQFALANGFAAKPGACLALPSADGQIAQVLFGLEESNGKFLDLFRPGLLPGLLPPGGYGFANAPHDTRLAVVAFAPGSYPFTRSRTSTA